MEKLLKALKSLISDIEAMQETHDPNWFGKFDTFNFFDEEGMNIEWPNLAISLEEVKTALKDLEGNQE